MNQNIPSSDDGQRKPVSDSLDAPAKRPEKLSPRYGWFKVFRKDRARIIEHCEGAAVSALSVWDALCDIQNENGSPTFKTSIGIIRTRAAVSRRTAQSALDLLQGLGMISREQNRIPGKKNALDLSTYTILTSGNGCTTPSGNGCTTPSASDEAHNLHRGIKNILPKGRIKKKGRGDQGNNAPEEQLPDSLPKIKKDFYES
jgi:hypothetical protein